MLTTTSFTKIIRRVGILQVRLHALNINEIFFLLHMCSSVLQIKRYTNKFEWI